MYEMGVADSFGNLSPSRACERDVCLCEEFGESDAILPIVVTVELQHNKRF